MGSIFVGGGGGELSEEENAELQERCVKEGYDVEELAAIVG